MTDAPERKKLTPHALRDHIRRLTLDWAYLRTNMPTPPRSEGRQASSHEYGHPAEWASDTAAKIVDILTSWHEALAENRNETPPPTGSEQHRLRAAWQYLDPRCDQLTAYAEDEALRQIPALHTLIRHVLGVTQPRQMLPVPCPNNDCGLRTLMRTVTVGGNDFIVCGSCAYTVQDTHYPLLVRIAIDTVVEGNA